MAYFSTGGGMTTTGSQRGPYASPPIWGGYKMPGATQAAGQQSPAQSPPPFGTPNQRGDTIPVWNQGHGQTREGYPINTFGGPRTAQPSAQPQAQAYQPPSPQLPSYQQPTQQAQPMNPSMMLGAQPYAAAQPMYGASQSYMNQADAPAKYDYSQPMGGMSYAQFGQTVPGTGLNTPEYLAYQKQEAEKYKAQQIGSGYLNQDGSKSTAPLSVNNGVYSRGYDQQDMAALMPQLQAQVAPLKNEMQQQRTAGHQMTPQAQQAIAAQRARASGIVGGYQKPTTFNSQSSPLLNGLMGY